MTPASASDKLMLKVRRHQHERYLSEGPARTPAQLAGSDRAAAESLVAFTLVAIGPTCRKKGGAVK